ncbi:MAG: hypothetical protein KKF46_06545 [Nanoarchaeota archaeon]|nr:hypothetical protein [Nanoarchaeota archaeon]MBU1321988.1 hypothetical protein [Nanoarchaeota archaeon]MBU1597978.1 hypothetical protein [Nanoarchaeota archaeon]MBU2441699.1 hypothetical protein [Nanoarchaeota archaeon]
MVKKNDSKKGNSKNKLLNWIKNIKVEDLLLIVVGISILSFILQLSHYALPGNAFKAEVYAAISFIYYLDIFVKQTSWKYIFFIIIPLFVIWIAKLFQKKTWNYKKTALWLGIGITVMLLIYFGAPNIDQFSNIPKAENPTVKVFVMSFCPFGQQAETALATVQSHLGNKVTIEPRFIISNLTYKADTIGLSGGCINNNTLCSLHGVTELNEDMRQLCIWKYYQDKWWDYVLCINDECTSEDVETCWEGCAQNNELSVPKIRVCQQTEGVKLAEIDRDLGDELEAYNSPTIIINDAIYKGTERTPETLKEAICYGFESPPDECKIKLKEENKDKIVQDEESATDKLEDFWGGCKEEGVCPKTGEKLVPKEIGEKNETG